MTRKPMTPAQFDAACRKLWKRFPELSETSGRRSVERNAAVGGNPQSKHVLGAAQDFVASMEVMREARDYALELGLWVRLHDAGSGDHLHVQSLPPGAVPEGWDTEEGEEMGKITEFLDGKKTYIAAILLGILVALRGSEIVTQEQFEMLAALLGGTGLAALRAGVTKSGV